MTTSGLYNAGTPTIEGIINEAYQRIGIGPSLIDTQRVLTAKLSLNFILQDWANYGNNLWVVRSAILTLIPNQSTYSFPAGGIDIKTMAVRTSIRMLSGTAASSSGVAANAFDGNPATVCDETAPDGWIGYNWTSARTIQMVGINAGLALIPPPIFTLTVETSADGITYTELFNIPAQGYPDGIIQWFEVPTPISAPYIRIRETGGATLSIRELYFNNNVSDTPMGVMSGWEYNFQPNKFTTSRPSSYWVDRQVVPTIYVWPRPTAEYNAAYITYWRAIQDVLTMGENAEIPPRFIQPLVMALAAELAVKESLPPEKITLLVQMSEAKLMRALSEDREKVPFRIQPSYSR